MLRTRRWPAPRPWRCARPAAGSNPAARLCNLLVGAALDALLKVGQARRREYRMGVRINKARQDYCSPAIEGVDRIAVFSSQRGDFFFPAGGDNFSAFTKNCRVFNDSQLQ